MTAPTPVDPWQGAADKEYVSEPHPAYGARVAAFWQDGTMHLQELGNGECACGFAGLHEPAAKVMATMVTGEAVRQPRETPVWYVQSGASSAQTARALALDVAKTLGWQLNPLFTEESTA